MTAEFKNSSSSWAQRKTRHGRSVFSGPFYVFCSKCTINPLRSRAIRLICHFENGQLWSESFRELMRRHYGVKIGMHSYGPALWPGGLPDGTKIGNYCSIGPGIAVFRRNHPSRRISQHPFFYNSALGLIPTDSIHADRDNPLTVEHDVWIGAKAIITPGCKSIGLGAVVAAGAVVTKDVPSFTVVGGNPARPIGERFPREIQDLLRESQWWKYPIARLLTVLPAFMEEATVENAQRLLTHLKTSILPE